MKILPTQNVSALEYNEIDHINALKHLYVLYQDISIHSILAFLYWLTVGGFFMLHYEKAFIYFYM